jgi:hypothetical protein
VTKGIPRDPNRMSEAVVNGEEVFELPSTNTIARSTVKPAAR